MELCPPAAQFVSDTCEKFAVNTPPFFHSLRESVVSCANTTMGNKNKTKINFFIFNKLQIILLNGYRSQRTSHFTIIGLNNCMLHWFNKR